MRFLWVSLCLVLGFASMSGGASADEQTNAVAASAQGESPMSRRAAVADLSATYGFQVSGLTHVQTDTIAPARSETAIDAIHEVLDGYSYLIELSPRVGSDDSPRQPLALHVLGRFKVAKTDRAAKNWVQNSAASHPAAGGRAEFSVLSHPYRSDRGVSRVNRALGDLALLTMPKAVKKTSAAPVLDTGSAISPTEASSAADYPTDLRVLTRGAQGSLQALVTGLQQACAGHTGC